MASSPYSGVLEMSLDAPQTAGYLGPVIRRNLEIASDTTSSMAVVKASSSPAPSPPPSPHPYPNRAELLTELGEYLSRSAMMLSVFTDNVLQGPHIDRLNRDLHRRCYADTTLSDLKDIAAEDAKFTRLRKIRDLTAQFSREVQAVWHPESVASEALPPGQVLMSPTSDIKPMSAASRSLSLSGSEGDVKPFRSRKVIHDSDQMDEVSPKSNGSGSEDSDDEDDDEQFQQIDMNALRQRGKGAYYCPKGRQCDKGGVDKEGNLVRFDRNSSFIQHCNKHRKPWRCELPGCPNPPKKRKFARRDGLERHKATVKHFVMT